MCISIKKFKNNITMLNCALDRSTILLLYVPGFQRQFFNYVKNLSDQIKRIKEQKKKQGLQNFATQKVNSSYT